MSTPQSSERGIEEMKEELWYKIAEWNTAQPENIDQYADDVEHFIHQELQKARASWLRSEIEKLEGMKMKSSCGCPPFQPQHEGYCWNEEFPGESRAHNQALTSIITRYKEELEVLEGK